MKTSFKDRMLSALFQTAKNHKFFKYPILAAAFLICCASSSGSYIYHNRKRYICTAVSFLFFALGSSFSFPVFEQKADIGVIPINIQDTALKTQQAEADKTQEGTKIEILEDADVIDGYEDTEISGLEDVPKYTLDEILEDNTEKVSSLEQTGETDPITANQEFDKNDWRYVLINKQNPIPDDFTVNLGIIKGNMKCDARIIDDLLRMLQAAKKDGINLVICSPYRDLNRQEVLFERKIKAYMQKGLTYLEAYRTASQAVTVPGASEHQIGLALDIVSDKYSSLNAGFGDTEAGKWLAANSCEYGFILRYPLGKEHITSIEYEPWHFRYVGNEAAKVITKQNITLEEFVENL